jgi:hypothetical protein
VQQFDPHSPPSKWRQRQICLGQLPERGFKAARFAIDRAGAFNQQDLQGNTL